MARCGVARQGEAGKAGHGLARPGLVRQGRHGVAGNGSEGQGEAGMARARQGRGSGLARQAWFISIHKGRCYEDSVSQLEEWGAVERD
jgi:hypothetical protein